MADETPLPGRTPPTHETEEQTTARIERLRGLGIATSTLRAATDVLSAINAGLRAQYDYARADAIYRTQMANIYDQAGLQTSDAFADATLRAARQVIATQRTSEALAAARLMIEQMADELARRKTPGPSPVAGYVAIGVAVLAVGAAVLYWQKTRPNPSRIARGTRYSSRP